ncbi:hypothetical protein KC678_02835 [Candidatus Dojkabacteria bacterium]|uniref:DUF5648 domain-containing protein n=1 Tax=Candidatus Dojkabacteria bacterium TaxID=2099670 RepID=A0A955IA98_9BACT|nr:hypothetical protein [Candidatus Dojkabacteria bacterium]
MVTKSKRFSTVLTLVLTFALAFAPAFVAPQVASADAPSLSFADIPGDSVTSDPDGITMTFESDQAGYIIYRGQCVSDTIVAVEGENTVTFNNVPENVYAEGDCNIYVFNEAGEISTALAVPAFTVDATAPKLSLTSVIDTPTTTSTPSVGIFLSEAADSLTYEGACDSSATSAVAGASTLTLRSADLEGAFESGTYSDCKVIATDEAGNESDALSIPSFEVILTSEIYIIQTGVALPSASGSTYSTFADDATRVVSLNVSHAGEIYADATSDECYPYPNTVTPGINKIMLTLDDLKYSDGTADCILEYRVATGSGDVSAASIATAPITITSLPDSSAGTGTPDTNAPDIEETTATLVTQANGSSVGFTFTVDEGGTWAIVDDAGAGTCSAALTGLTPENNLVHPGVNTIIVQAADAGLADGTYGDGTNTCDIEVTDGTTSANTATVNMPQFTISDSKGPSITITKPVVSPVASGAAVVFRFTSNEFVDAADIVEPDLLLSGDCFDADVNTAWDDFATDAVIDDEGASGNEDIVTPGLTNAYNTFTITAGEIDDGVYSNCKFRLKDAAGNNSNTVNIPTFTVGAAGPKLENAAYSAGTITNPVTVTFTSDKSGTYSFTDVGGTVLASSACKVNGYVSDLPLKAGANSVTFDNMDDAAATCYIRGYDSDGRAGTILTFGPFTVDDDGDPKLSEVTEVDPTTLSYTFYSSTGGDITYDGFCASTDVYAMKGNNTITFNALPEGLVADNCEVTVTSNDTADTLNVSKFTAMGTTPLSGAAGTVWRFWNPTTMAHFYTADPAEANYVRDSNPNWSYEAAVFKGYEYTDGACVDGTELFRFYNPTVGVHFYTPSVEEKDYIIDTNPNWTYEAVAYCVMAEETTGHVPMYQFWSDARQAHFYTIDAAEKAYVEADLGDIYRFEGIVFYVLAL